MRVFFLLAELFLLLFFAYLIYLWWVSRRELWKSQGKESAEKDAEISNLKSRLEQLEKK